MQLLLTINNFWMLLAVRAKGVAYQGKRCSIGCANTESAGANECHQARTNTLGTKLSWLPWRIPIGSTLGAIAAKASAVSDSLSDSSFLQTAKREKIVRKGKTVARGIKKPASKNVKSNKLAKATHRGLRHAATAAKRAVRPVPVKKKVAKRVRRKK